MIKSFFKRKFSTEHRTILYVSLIVAIAFNINTLLSSFNPEIQIILDVPWVFNFFEFLYQVAFSWTCFFVLGILLLNSSLIRQSDTKKQKAQKLTRILLFLAFSLIIGLFFQKHFFDNLMNSSIYRNSFIGRFVVGSSLIYVLVRVLNISNDRKMKALENERLKLAYSDAQLKNLRAQINPHFLFNAFANLSSLMNEDVGIAQRYVANLSKVFRYSLNENTSTLVELSKELESLNANIELLKIRHQDNLSILIDIKNPEYYEIPVMSLQPLLDNVTKHNIISEINKASITMTIKNDKLYFHNTLTVQKHDAASNGIGLHNLNERFKLLLHKEIEISKTENEFLVVLPLYNKQK